MGEIPVYKAFASLSKTKKLMPQERSALSCSPKAGPLWKQMPISEPCLMYLSGSPVKEPFLEVPFMESFAETCPAPRALHLSKSPVYETPPGSPRF